MWTTSFLIQDLNHLLSCYHSTSELSKPAMWCSHFKSLEFNGKLTGFLCNFKDFKVLWTWALHKFCIFCVYTKPCIQFFYVGSFWKSNFLVLRLDYSRCCSADQDGLNPGVTDVSHRAWPRYQFFIKRLISVWGFPLAKSINIFCVSVLSYSTNETLALWLSCFTLA